MVVLKDKESALRKREELLLEVERGITACHISIENCIEREVQEGLKVTSYALHKLIGRSNRSQTAVNYLLPSEYLNNPVEKVML